MVVFTRIILSRAGFGVAVYVGVAVWIAGPRQALDAAIKELKNMARDYAYERAGLVLNENEPFSDASFSAALSQKTGIKINSLLDSAQLKADIAAHAALIVEEKSGIHLTNVLSVGAIKSDVTMHVLGVVRDKGGLDLMSAVANGIDWNNIQKAVIEEVKKKAVQLVTRRIQAAAMKFTDVDASIDELLAMVHNTYEGRDIGIRDVGYSMAAAIIVERYGQMSAPVRRRITKFKRRIQNREAQRRFREKHGSRIKYLPIPKNGG